MKFAPIPSIVKKPWIKYLFNSKIPNSSAVLSLLAEMFGDVALLEAVELIQPLCKPACRLSIRPWAGTEPDGILLARVNSSHPASRNQARTGVDRFRPGKDRFSQLRWKLISILFFRVAHLCRRCRGDWCVHVGAETPIFVTMNVGYLSCSEKR